MQPILQQLFDREDLLLTYSPGWNLQQGFAQVLSKSLIGIAWWDIPPKVHNEPISKSILKALVPGALCFRTTKVIGEWHYTISSHAGAHFGTEISFVVDR